MQQIRFAAHRTGRGQEGKHMTVAGVGEPGQRWFEAHLCSRIAPPLTLASVFPPSSTIDIPTHVRSPRSGFGKPPRIHQGARTSTDPGTRIVNRIVFRMGPIVLVIVRSKTSSGQRQAARQPAQTYCKINRDGRESSRSFRSSKVDPRSFGSGLRRHPIHQESAIGMKRIALRRY
jgi:hypothetical protein